MRKIIISLLVIVSIISCKKSPDATPKNMEITTEEHQEKHADWSYKGDQKPEHWSHLSEAYKDCAGSAQSPININDTMVVSASKAYNFKINYSKSAVNIINNGHTIQFNIDAGNSLTFDNKTYQLLQFHTHSLSEHTINKKYLPLEVHFVNKADDGTYAVIGVLFEEGKESAFLANYINHFPTVIGEYKEDTTFGINQVLPNDTSFYHYNGSFTTPPCTEIVEWIVLKEKLAASKEQLDQMHQLLDNNYRPIQKLNGRIIDSQ
jgi:carbonic anhydrase